MSLTARSLSLLIVLYLSACGDSATPPPLENVRDVVINGVRLTDAEILDIEQRYGVEIENASYWHDARSGAWGIDGGPTRGFMLAGLQLGGPLKADASGGAPTGTFVNGRELHPLDISGLSQCANVQRGRFWVVGDGTGGLEGAPATFNLLQLCGAGAAHQCGWVCDGGRCPRSCRVMSPGEIDRGRDRPESAEDALILTPD